MASDVLMGNDQDAARWIRQFRTGPGRRRGRRAPDEPPSRRRGATATPAGIPGVTVFSADVPGVDVPGLDVPRATDAPVDAPPVDVAVPRLTARP